MVNKNKSQANCNDDPDSSCNSGTEIAEKLKSIGAALIMINGVPVLVKFG